jgi:hypothetical protein
MGANNRLLVGQIAVELGFVTREQLQECIDLQAGQVQPKPVGTLLQENGFLTPEKLAAVLDEQRRRLQESLPYAPAQRGAVAFGHLIVERGLVKQEHVNEALRAQQDLADRGIRKRLGELLVEAGHLTAEAVPDILKAQGKVLMACTFCGAHFNVLITIAEGYPCRKCGMPLDRKTGIVSADETAYLLPAVDPRPRLSSAEMPRPQAPAAEIVSAAPPVGREFLGRLARILTIIGILTLILWLMAKS